MQRRRGQEPIASAGQETALPGRIKMLNQRYAGVATTQTPKSYVCARAEAGAGAGAGEAKG